MGQYTSLLKFHVYALYVQREGLTVPLLNSIELSTNWNNILPNVHLKSVRIGYHGNIASSALKEYFAETSKFWNIGSDRIGSARKMVKRKTATARAVQIN